MSRTSSPKNASIVVRKSSGLFSFSHLSVGTAKIYTQPEPQLEPQPQPEPQSEPETESYPERAGREGVGDVEGALPPMILKSTQNNLYP